MKNLRIRSFALIILVMVLSSVLLLSSPASAKRQHKKFPYNPVIFVHGGSGSGAQFESQAQRFASNGYPQKYLNVHEYDSRFNINTMEDVHARLDQLIADLKDKLGVDQVDILGHSLGTTVMQGYLAFPDRAVNVAHYVNIDGRTADALPGGVPTLALWAETALRPTPGGETREIVGAWNVTIPGTTHVEVATCAESFPYIYEFFTGKEPRTTDIVSKPWGRIKLAGRAVWFPENSGAEGATVEIWKLNGCTGKRIRKTPAAVYYLSEGGDHHTNGDWGPFEAKAGQYYEFVVKREALGLPDHHFYYEPFLRSDYLIRLNTSGPGGLEDYMDYSESQSNVILLRYKELFGDQGINNDILTINGVNVISPETNPISKAIIAMYISDKGSDGVTELGVPLSPFNLVTFLTGVDVFIPGADPVGTTRLALIPRGGGGKIQMLNIGNWSALEGRRITVQFNDYIQQNSIPSCRWHYYH